MKYSYKSDKMTIKAAKARKKIAENNTYIEKMKKKASSLSQNEINNGYEFVNKLKDL